jgi:hypothetical protein
MHSKNPKKNASQDTYMEAVVAHFSNVALIHTTVGDFLGNFRKFIFFRKFIITFTFYILRYQSHYVFVKNAIRIF